VQRAYNQMITTNEKQELRGILAYDVEGSMTKEEYDEWLWKVHYPDLLSNPYLKKITLNTTSATKPRSYELFPSSSQISS